MKAFEDFLLIYLHAHVVSAAKHVLSTMSYDGVEDLAKEIITQFVVFGPNVRISVNDKVHLYAVHVLTLGLVWFAFNDAIKEGDGDRILTCYKFILYIFKSGLVLIIAKKPYFY